MKRQIEETQSRMFEDSRLHEREVEIERRKVAAAKDQEMEEVRLAQKLAQERAQCREQEMKRQIEETQSRMFEEKCKVEELQRQVASTSV
jgi:hypothetical protein